VTRAAGLAAAPLLPWLARRASFRALPARLLVASEPQAADLIHVLGGGHAGEDVRIDHAVALHRRGFAPLLLLTGSEWGIDWARHNAARALARGVPEAALRLDSAPRTTRAEARALRRLLAREPVRSVLLVTEAFHAGRASRVFARTLRGTGVRLRSCPVGADRFPPPRWWEDRTQRALVLGEALRLLLARATGGAAPWPA
jgi:uncharacterized SAM-binding protein YcdF (DUF218 family)